MNKDKPMSWLNKNLTWALAASLIVFVIATGYLMFDLNGYARGGWQANYYFDNVLIEVVVGGLFMVVPIFVGVHLGKKLKEYAFYANIKRVIDKIRILRQEGSLAPKKAKELVIEISDSMGQEVLDASWASGLSILPPTPEYIRTCNVCGEDGHLDDTKTKCRDCKLSCFLWDDGN
ncbi:MAG: hypothetical protein WBD16_09560 [Pyrinomonadaceae bacterium]